MDPKTQNRNELTVEERNAKFRKSQGDKAKAIEIVEQIIRDSSFASAYPIIDSITDDNVKREVMADMAMRLVCIRGYVK